eukprot:12407322-Alexandrium_andersonii.AAC.1
MREGVGALSSRDAAVVRRATCLNDLWSVKMGDQITRGEGGTVLDFWGFRVPRTANSPEVPLEAEWVPPFEPGINDVQFSSYPTEVIED